MNYLRAESDLEAEKYNREVYDKYLKNLEVDPRTVAYKSVKNVDKDFVTTDEIGAMLRQKYRHSGVTQKSDEDIEKMVIAVTNIINKTPNPIGNVSTALSDPQVLSEISNVSNNLSNNQLSEMDIENQNCP
jgi:hypothetical protein